MMEQQKIQWSSDAGKARDEAKRSGKLILFFFHSKTCSGCQATIARVLPDARVSREINEGFVPLMFEVSEPASQDLIKQYDVQWTPTFVVADENGDVADRWVGFLPVEDFRAHVTMAEAKAAFKKNDFDKAYKYYNAVAEEFPKSDLAPEAVYYRGVSLYKRSKDPSYLKKTNDELKSRYPDNIWAKKASVWGQ